MAKITQLSQLDLTAHYSYADYVTWQLSEAVELIKGKIQLMSPAPNVKHQKLSIILSSRLFNYFENKACQVFSAPFDVRLYDRKKSLLANKEITTVSNSHYDFNPLKWQTDSTIRPVYERPLWKKCFNF